MRAVASASAGEKNSVRWKLPSPTWPMTYPGTPRRRGAARREPEPQVAHAPVAPRHRAGGVRRRPPAEARLGARVDGEEEPGGAQVLVEPRVRDAGLNHGQE